ncbi:MAG: hypothetical protein KF716_24060 [Anaerolineae bacterium]|nr:hypothetical protein [Anaerolineae bacterium]
MIVGITGHQDIGTTEVVAWVSKTLDAIVSSGSIDLGVSCLARGADQLYATTLLKHAIPYIAVIASKDYATTFEDEETRSNFQVLKSKAVQIYVLDHDVASEQAFYDAGKLLVDKSDQIIAIWNGEKARGLGGTGDIVQYALVKQKRIVHVNTITKTINELP